MRPSKVFHSRMCAAWRGATRCADPGGTCPGWNRCGTELAAHPRACPSLIPALCSDACMHRVPQQSGSLSTFTLAVHDLMTVALCAGQVHNHTRGYRVYRSLQT